jgi:hypothetical protein
MNTHPSNRIFLPLVLAALAFAGVARAAGDTDPRFASDKPAVKYLFTHTAGKPYDIKSLAWYGGVMERIVVENKSDRPITVDFQITRLANDIVAVPARTLKVSKACLPGADTAMMDLMSSDGGSTLVYQFTHDFRLCNTLAGGMDVREKSALAIR